MNTLTHPLLKMLVILFTLFALSACNIEISEPGDNSPNAEQPAAADVSLTLQPVKSFRFDWQPVQGATHYVLQENPDGQSGFSDIVTDIPGDATSYVLEVPLYARVNAQYLLLSCNGSKAGCTQSNTLAVSGTLVPGIGYVKADNTGRGDQFGRALSLSDDGTLLAVGAPYESSNTTGVNNDQNDAANHSGAVYLYRRTAPGTWALHAFVKASNTGVNDYFGTSVSLSGDGHFLAVGAPEESGSDTGINTGSQSTNSKANSGAVYLFHDNGDGNWQQQSYVKASNTDANDYFGEAVSLNDDGTVLAVGAYQENSNAREVNGNDGNNSSNGAGAVYVYERAAGASWSSVPSDQVTYIKASNTGEGDNFGYSVSLNGNGKVLAVGAPSEDGSGTGVNPSSNNGLTDAGAVYLYRRLGGEGTGRWEFTDYIKPSTKRQDSKFGTSVSLDKEGRILAVGAPTYFSKGEGAVDLYRYDSTGKKWTWDHRVQARNADSSDHFGSKVSLSDNGRRLMASAALYGGAYRFYGGEASQATGINGNDNDNSAEKSGAVYSFVYQEDSKDWVQEAYIKASNTNAEDGFGAGLALSGDGQTLAVGATSESSNAKELNGDQTDNSVSDAGAVYLY